MIRSAQSKGAEAHQAATTVAHNVTNSNLSWAVATGRSITDDFSNHDDLEEFDILIAVQDTGEISEMEFANITSS